MQFEVYLQMDEQAELCDARLLNKESLSHFRFGFLCWVLSARPVVPKRMLFACLGYAATPCWSPVPEPLPVLCCGVCSPPPLFTPPGCRWGDKHSVTTGVNAL